MIFNLNFMDYGKKIKFSIILKKFYSKITEGHFK